MPIKINLKKRQVMPTVGQDMEQLELTCLANRNVKYTTTLEDLAVSYQVKFTTQYSNPTSGLFTGMN